MPTIPQEYPGFDRPTLVVTTDSTQAKLYLAQDRSVEPLEALASGYPPHADDQRVSGRAGDTHFAEQNEKDKIVSREKLYAAVNAELLKLLADGRFQDLVLCAPEEHLAELKESLHINLLKHAITFVPKLLTTEDWLDVILHVQETK